MLQSHGCPMRPVQPWMLIVSSPSFLLTFSSALPRVLSDFVCLLTHRKNQHLCSQAFHEELWREVTQGRRTNLDLVTSSPARVIPQGPSGKVLDYRKFKMILEGLQCCDQSVNKALSRHLIVKIMSTCFEVIRMQ